MLELLPGEPFVAAAGADAGRRRATATQARGAQTLAVTSARAEAPTIILVPGIHLGSAGAARVVELSDTARCEPLVIVPLKLAADIATVAEQVKDINPGIFALGQKCTRATRCERPTARLCASN
jgi:hypothetical protein